VWTLKYAAHRHDYRPGRQDDNLARVSSGHPAALDSAGRSTTGVRACVAAVSRAKGRCDWEPNAVRRQQSVWAVWARSGATRTAVGEAPAGATVAGNGRSGPAVDRRWREHWRCADQSTDATAAVEPSIAAATGHAAAIVAASNHESTIAITTTSHAAAVTAACRGTSGAATAQLTTKMRMAATGDRSVRHRTDVRAC
jgi:hypothetical protein